MAETFRCPACSAPLEFEGKMMQKCRHCGSSVIVPSDVMRFSNSFGDKGSLDLNDAPNATGKALKVAEIRRELQRGNKIVAIKIFRETFDVGLKEAKDAVEAMERGESIDISGAQIKTANVQANALTSGAAEKAGGVSILVPLLVIGFIAVLIIGAALFFIFSAG